MKNNNFILITVDGDIIQNLNKETIIATIKQRCLDPGEYKLIKGYIIDPLSIGIVTQFPNLK